MLDPVKNFGVVTVSTGYSDSDTSIVLSGGDGATLPDPSTDGAFNLVWYNSSDYFNPTDDPNKELVRVTARSADTLTVVRAQEGTSASTKNTAGKTYKMVLAFTKKMRDDMDRILSGLPEGTMWNGKIVPSVSSSNLTVAIKTLAGSDPSESDPVYCRIGDTVRSITAAISVTLAGGTNWFNAGSSELATKEIDYFVYLGYNATDGVVIGFSRIPFANLYSDFSATTTNEKYAGISTITNAVAGDNYVNIGRFAATLSAGAGYTWSVPTYTAKNLIQRPIYETRWLSWLPTYTGSGSLTYASVTGDRVVYKISGNNLFIEIKTSGTTGGTTSSSLYFTAPFSRVDTTAYLVSGGGWIYDGADASGFCGWNSTSQTQLRVSKYNIGNISLTASAQFGVAVFYGI